MDPLQHVARELPRRRGRAQSGRIERGANALDARRHLGRVDEHAAIEERLARMMRVMRVGSDDQHGVHEFSMHCGREQHRRGEDRG